MSQRSKLRKVIVKSVKKATGPKVKPPNEKYIQIILSHTFRKTGIEEVQRALLARLNKKNWSIVLKALVLFHRCFKEADPQFIEKMTGKANDYFSLNIFKATAPTRHMLTIFITKYAKYLEENVNVVRALQFQFGKERQALQDLSDKEFLDVIPRLQSQLNALCNCKLKVKTPNYPLITYAYRTLIKDSFILFSMLNDAMQDIGPRFYSYSKKNAIKCLSIYKLYIKEAGALENMYDGAKIMFSDLPKIRNVDSEIVSELESHLAERPDDDDEYDNGLDAQILNTAINDDDDVLNTVSNFGNFDESGSNSDESSSGGNVTNEPDDFLSMILGMGNSTQSSAFYISPSINNMTPNPLKISSPYSTSQSPPSSIDGGNPFGNNQNPFGTGSAQNPFGGNNTSQPNQNPFGITTPQSNQNPFGDSSNATQPVQNPFGGNGTTQQTGQNPFGGNNSTQQPAQNPFGGSGSLGNGQPNQNPFGGTTTAPPNQNPFGGTTTVPPNQNPFGGSAKVQPTQNPFGGSSTVQPAQNPFGGNGSVQIAEVKSNPFTFDEPAQQNPFGGNGNPQPNPFSISGTAKTDNNPFF